MAHNGYLEVYLELGVVGLCFLAALLCSAFLRTKALAQRQLRCRTSSTGDVDRLLLYNVTESGYRITTSMCFVLLLVSVEFPVALRSVTALPAVPRPRYPPAKTGGRMKVASPGAWQGVRGAARAGGWHAPTRQMDLKS